MYSDNDNSERKLDYEHPNAKDGSNLRSGKFN